jgi:hypothetical protein
MSLDSAEGFFYDKGGIALKRLGVCENKMENSFGVL